MRWFSLVSATPPASQLYGNYGQNNNGLGLSQTSSQNSGLSKYAQLLAVIEEMGRDIRPTYAMGRGDRLKRLIIQAKVNYIRMHFLLSSFFNTFHLQIGVGS